MSETLLKPVLEMCTQGEHTVLFILSITGQIYITCLCLSNASDYRNSQEAREDKETSRASAYLFVDK